MSDLVERLRELLTQRQSRRAAVEAQAADHIEAQATRLAQCESLMREATDALEKVMVGGNHLALLIGADHPPYTASPAVAMEHYRGGDTYEAWCCWRAIMIARDTLAKLEGPSK